LAVAPVGSVLLAVAVGADLVAVDDLAALAAAGAATAGVAGAAAGAAAAGAGAVAAVAGLAFAAFWMPPWPLHVPLPEEVVVVPSEHVVVAPVAAGVAGVAVFAGAAAEAGVFAAFCTPPWPLQVPLPVDVVVVPSLHVVGAGSAAKLGTANASINKGAATRAATVIFFMNVHSLVYLFRSAAKSVIRFLADGIAAQGAGRIGNMPVT
jgi:hypothetical protein